MAENKKDTEKDDVKIGYGSGTSAAVKSVAKQKAAENGKKKKKTDKTSLRYILNPANLSAEISDYGKAVNGGRIVLLYLVFMAALLAISWAFQLWKIPMVIVTVSGLIMLPVIVRNAYKKQFEQKRFSDVSQYMEQMLYSFRNNRKILKSLSDIESLFDEGTMHDCIREAEHEIISGKGSDVEAAALRIIEKQYKCEKLRTMHRFMLKVETLGGDFSESVDLLLQDRSMWVDRVLKFQNEKKSRRVMVSMSIVISLLICLFMQRVVPSKMPIMNNPVSQVITCAVLVIDLILYVYTDFLVSVDWLENRDMRTSDEVLKMYDYVANYDADKAKRSRLQGVVLAVCIAAGGVIFKSNVLVIIAAVIFVFALVRARVKKASYLRALRKEVDIKFPRWLMEISLQIQSENVQVAIFKSIDSAPTVLKPELIKLKEGLDKDPSSIRPYLDFMKILDMPEVSSSMKMLYAVSAGTGGDVETQIAEIIRRNNAMLDRAEQQNNEDSLAGLYALFLAPQITAGIKIVCDMVFFFIYFMSMMQ